MLEWTLLLEYLSYHMYSIIIALIIGVTVTVYNYGTYINQKKAEHYYRLILPSIQKHFKLKKRENISIPFSFKFEAQILFILASKIFLYAKS